jgi:hypothetical protein
MFNVLFALLAEKLVLTEKEAQALAEKISVSLLPSDYNEAVKLVRKILAKL